MLSPMMTCARCGHVHHLGEACAKCAEAHHLAWRLNTEYYQKESNAPEIRRQNGEGRRRVVRSSGSSGLPIGVRREIESAANAIEQTQE